MSVLECIGFVSIIIFSGVVDWVMIYIYMDERSPYLKIVRATVFLMLWSTSSLGLLAFILSGK